MKILTVVYSLGKGGTQRGAQNFAEGYAKNGHNSRVVATKEGGLREAELAARGIFTWALLSEDVLVAIKDWRPDVVHIHSHGLTQADFDAIVAQVPAAKIVETNVFSAPSPWVARLDNSFQLSEWCKWIYRTRAGAASAASVVPYPVGTSAFFKVSEAAKQSFRLQYGLTSEHIVLGRIGQNYSGKWSPLLIDLLEDICELDQRFRLLVVNPPNTIIDRIHESRFVNRFHIIDQIVGDDNLRVVYSVMDVFVLIADQGESFGMVTAESMLCETPVVAYSTPWGDNSQCEVVGHMEGGLIVTTPNGLKNAVMHLANDKQLREDLGRRGRKRIVDRYDSEKIADLALAHISPGDKTISTTDSTQSIVRIYKDAFDTPPAIAILIIRLGKFLSLLRYVTGYQPWSLFAKRVGQRLVKLGRS